MNDCTEISVYKYCISLCILHSLWSKLPDLFIFLKNLEFRSVSTDKENISNCISGDKKNIATLLKHYSTYDVFQG